MRRFLEWIATPVPRWHFWDPRTGLIGGIVTGLVFFLFMLLVHFIEELEIPL